MLKQDGVFVCQTCGCKYSVEEAKKMMIEGTVDVSGSTVKVDNSSYVQKSLENARRAKAKEDWEECEKYYNRVEQYDPHNIEAIFYSSYGKAKMSMVDSDRFKREQKVNVLKKSISVIDDNYDNSPEKYEENKQLIQQINDDLLEMMNGNFVYNTRTQNGATSNDSSYTYAMFVDLAIGFVESLKNIAKVIEDPKKTVYLFKIMRDQYIYVYMHCNKNAIDRAEEKIKDIDQIIMKLDSNYQPQQLPYRKTGGCYVATCIYGSYDCPQVWTLRRYRDNILAETWHGRTFIRLYYAVSPTLVQWFGHTRWFKKLWRGKLDRMVHRLQEKGVENTPYEDKEW